MREIWPAIVDVKGESLAVCWAELRSQGNCRVRVAVRWGCDGLGEENGLEAEDDNPRCIDEFT